jgi:hypothetical protein
MRSIGYLTLDRGKLIPRIHLMSATVYILCEFDCLEYVYGIGFIRVRFDAWQAQLVGVWVEGFDVPRGEATGMVVCLYEYGRVVGIRWLR